MAHHVVWRRLRWPIDERFDHTLNIVLLVVRQRVLLSVLLQFHLLLLVHYELGDGIASCTWLRRAQWRRRIHDELALQDLAADDGRERLAKVLADFHELLDLNLQIIINIDLLRSSHPRIVVRVECALQRVAVQNAELLEHDKAACRLFLLFICELAVREREQLVLLVQQIRHDADEIVVLVLVDLRLW